MAFPEPLPATIPQPTAHVLPTQTSNNITFDRDGYKQFALLRNQYPGFMDYLGERNYSQISASLSPDGSRIAISACWGSLTNTMQCETSKSGFLVVLDTGTGDLITDIPLGEGWPGRTAFTADGTSLVYTTQERKVAIWNISTNTRGLTLYNVPGSRATRYPDVAVSPDGQSYAAVVETTLFVWNTAGELLFQAPASQARWYAALSYSADGSRLTAFSSDRSGVDIYDTSNWTLVRQINQDEIEDAAISPDGLVLATINAPGNSVDLWDAGSGDLFQKLKPDHMIQTLAFNPKGDLLILIGPNDLRQPDDYSAIGSVYETQSWTKLDSLYSFSSDGEVRFSHDGKSFGILGYGFNSIWGMPDAQLKSGLEVLKRFQSALADGDFTTAASLFEVDMRDAEYLQEMGVNPDDLAGSLKNLCEDQTIFCHPVKELVLMGYDWDDMVYMVRLQGADGGTFVSPKGAGIIFIYLVSGAKGQPRVSSLPQDMQ